MKIIVLIVFDIKMIKKDLTSIFDIKGINGFFRGFLPTIIREMPGYFFFFGAYEGTRELLRK